VLFKSLVQAVLAYADDVHSLGDNIDTAKKNIETLIDNNNNN
jgi:hypothetical protein